jgi:nucleotide-binding universal stress UspA family protein
MARKTAIFIERFIFETYSAFREAHIYHFQGIDQMAKDQQLAKEKVIEAVKKLAEIHKVRPNAFLTRVFFDAKADEIVSIFSGGQIPITELVDTLNRFLR